MAIKALIADDSCLDREILAYALRSAGVQDVVQASDGDEATRMFEQEPFDLVVTDWNMPRCTGLDVVRAIRARGSTVPIVMVTGESAGANRAAAMLAGVSEFFTKPINAAAFLAVLAKHLQPRKPSALS